MKSGYKRHLNSLKGTDNRIRFLQKLIADKNEHIKYLENELKKRTFIDTGFCNCSEKGKTSAVMTCPVHG